MRGVELQDGLADCLRLHRIVELACYCESSCELVGMGAPVETPEQTCCLGVSGSMHELRWQAVHMTRRWRTLRSVRKRENAVLRLREGVAVVMGSVAIRQPVHLQHVRRGGATDRTRQRAVVLVPVVTVYAALHERGHECERGATEKVSAVPKRKATT